MPSPPTRRAILIGASAAQLARALSESALLPFERPAYPDIPEPIKALWQRALGNGAKTSSPAVLVSAEQHGNLPPLRGWRDVTFLNAYLNWADRPEAAGFQESDGTATLFADTGPHDWVLFRRPFRTFQIDAPTQADPIGFTIIKPRPGWNRIRLTRVPISGPNEVESRLSGLSARPLPELTAAVLVSSTADAHVVTLYGSGFTGAKVEILSEAGPGEVLYASPTQINARITSKPGQIRTRVSVSVDGVSTLWVPVTR